MADLIKLYDENGERVGAYCIETGRAQIGMNFFVVERACKNDSLNASSSVFFCSNCGLHIDIAYMESVDDYNPKYCPECGSVVIH